MARVGLLTCYAGLMASVAAPNFSLALSLRSAAGIFQENRLSSTLYVSTEKTPPTAEDKTNECLTIINTLRTENFNGLLTALATADDGEVTASLDKIQKKTLESPTAKKIAEALAGDDATTCDLAASANAETYPGLVIPFAYNTTFDCKALIRATYEAGLSHLRESSFDPSTDTYNVTLAPFNNVAASNTAFLLSSKSAKVSCAATKNCEAGQNVLFCYFIDPLQTGDAPFTTEVYNALWGVGKGAASILVPSVSTALLSLALTILT
ncbi:SAG family member [Eimeria necatrix]|uniref:SAG family member n=1 Tax=Eimeria necatrix TaxID=51315 RepID=U6MD90_9EIME|nr:SAG family member [Eimeria necatrix]CDJ62187.1 SAG family member [Eimeria necatrix]